jgi:hypothetical protein
MPPPTSVWRDRDFVRYWTGQTVSEVGSQVTELALPLVALLQLGATSTEVGVLRQSCSSRTWCSACQPGCSPTGGDDAR